jgi:hypothetical protein
MDMASTILICTPIFLPIMAQYGMNPVQFGIVLLVNCALGLNTPPVGTKQFVGCVAKFRDVLRELKAAKEESVAVGDGANLKMMKEAGISVAFRAKPVVQAQASCALNWSGLDGVVNLLSDLTRRHWQAGRAPAFDARLQVHDVRESGLR